MDVTVIANIQPYAVPGEDINVGAGANFILDGSSSYDLENISLIRNSDIPIGNESMISENSEMLRKYQNGEYDNEYFLPKDLAFILTNEYYIHPTYGFSGKYIYNYFDKMGFSFHTMYLSDLINNYADNIYWVFGLVLDDEFHDDAEKFMGKLRKYGIGTRPFFGLCMNSQF